MQRLKWLLRGSLPAEPLFLEMEATSIDQAAKTVSVKCASDSCHKRSSGPPVTSDDAASGGETKLSYDYLVYAVGADNNTFGTKGVKENCRFLKEVEDVRLIRNEVRTPVSCHNPNGQGFVSYIKQLFYVQHGWSSWTSMS
jgi:NADH dehydrogenase FAD-containing subunit